jgi:hypothetical protein
MRRQDVRGVVLWIGGDDLAERRLRAAAITGTKRLLRVAHLLLDFRRLRQRAGSKQKQKQSAHSRKFYNSPAGLREVTMRDGSMSKERRRLHACVRPPVVTVWRRVRPKRAH